MLFRGVCVIVALYTVLIWTIYTLTGEEPPLSVTVSAGIEEAAKRLVTEEMIRK